MKSKMCHKDFRPEFLNNPKNEYSKQMKKLENAKEREAGLKEDILEYFVDGSLAFKRKD